MASVEYSNNYAFLTDFEYSISFQQAKAWSLITVENLRPSPSQSGFDTNPLVFITVLSLIWLDFFIFYGFLYPFVDSFFHMWLRHYRDFVPGQSLLLIDWSNVLIGWRTDLIKVLNIDCSTTKGKVFLEALFKINERCSIFTDFPCTPCTRHILLKKRHLRRTVLCKILGVSFRRRLKCFS